MPIGAFFCRAGMITALDTPGRAGEDDLGHEFQNLDWMVSLWPTAADAVKACLTAAGPARKYLEPF